MKMVEIDWHPPRRTVIAVSAIALPVFITLGGGGFALARGAPRLALAALVVAGGLALGSIASEPLARAVYRWWMRVALPIGWLTSHLVLGAVFYAGIAPVGLVLRAAGRDRLALRRSPGWRQRSPRPPRSYLRQF